MSDLDRPPLAFDDSDRRINPRFRHMGIAPAVANIAQNSHPMALAARMPGLVGRRP